MRQRTKHKACAAFGYAVGSGNQLAVVKTRVNPSMTLVLLVWDECHISAQGVCPFIEPGCLSGSWRGFFYIASEYTALGMLVRGVDASRSMQVPDTRLLLRPILLPAAHLLLSEQAGQGGQQSDRVQGGCTFGVLACLRYLGMCVTSLAGCSLVAPQTLAVLPLPRGMFEQQADKRQFALRVNC